ncbi:MAG TPA: DEAD/DEAH box helicase, partial [Gemmatimonadaceae bacterium]|nr:DEAD/DEAH box helicase [Gemmatimonadaceae bacterium]
VIDEETADGGEARVSRTSVCGSWGPIAGELRYFADRSGNPRAAIEGTQIPMQLIRRYATRGISEIAFDARHKGGQLVIQRTLEYFGFELERDVEVVDEFPTELAGKIRHALAEALAKGQVRHPSVKRNRAAVDEIRETYRRSGGKTPRFGLADLTRWYEERLHDVRSMNALRNLRLTLNPDEIVSRDLRESLGDLPGAVIIRDREVDVEYDVEDQDGSPFGVARLRLPEKLARTITEDELPALDRPMRFVVIRGQRGAVRANTLDELQDLLTRPWSPDETDEADDIAESVSGDERRARELANRKRHSRRRDGRAARGARTGGENGERRGGGRPSGKPRRGGGSRRRFRGR